MKVNPHFREIVSLVTGFKYHTCQQFAAGVDYMRQALDLPKVDHAKSSSMPFPEAMEKVRELLKAPHANIATSGQSVPVTSNIAEIIDLASRVSPKTLTEAQDQLALIRTAIGKPDAPRYAAGNIEEQRRSREADMKRARDLIKVGRGSSVSSVLSSARKPIVTPAKKPAEAAKPDTPKARRAALLKEYQAQAPGAPRRAFFAQHEKDLFLAARESQPIKS